MKDLLTSACDKSIEFMEWHAECELLIVRAFTIPICLVAYLVMLITDITLCALEDAEE